MSKVVWYTEHGHDSREFEDPTQARTFADEKKGEGYKVMYIPGKNVL